MPPGARHLDGSTIAAMRRVGPGQLDPTIRIANWFDCRPGMRWGPRWEHDPELCLAHAGRFRYRVAGGAWQEFGAGCVLLIPPAVEHELEPLPGRSGLSCWHGELVDDGAAWADGGYLPDGEPRTITDLSGSPFVLAAFRRLAEAWSGYGPARAAICRDLVRLVWLHLFEAWGPAARASPSPRLEPMLAWIRERLDRPLDRNHVARAFALTPQHVNALFKQGLGVTPGAFIRRERVLRAWHDLHVGGLPVAAAARRWGFDDPFHFSRVFRSVMGFPPSRARR